VTITWFFSFCIERTDGHPGNVKDLRGYAIRATDGVIDKVHDFYFDDENWVVR
jgi:hypothetical protein